MTKWDSEIDDIAREMTEAEPDAGFKSRVLARLASPDRGQRPWAIGTWPRVAIAAVTLAAAVALLAPWRPGQQTTSVRGTDRRLERGPDSSPDAPGRAREIGAASRAEGPASDLRGARIAVASTAPINRARTTSDRARGSAEAARVSATSDETGSLEPSLLEVEPLAVDAMEALETIQVPRLAVSQLDVPAIGEE